MWALRTERVVIMVLFSQLSLWIVENEAKKCAYFHFFFLLTAFFSVFPPTARPARPGTHARAQHSRLPTLPTAKWHTKFAPAFANRSLECVRGAMCGAHQTKITSELEIKHFKTSEISVILISSKKYAKNIFNFQLTTQNATKDPDELPDDWPQRVQELLLQQLLLYYNHHREILSCFLEITTMKMNIRPVIFLPPECIIVQPLMTTHKNVWDLFCWNTL